MNDPITEERIELILEDIYGLFRTQGGYLDVSTVEHDLIGRIQYASAVVQAEKVTPPGGWDPFGR